MRPAILELPRTVPRRNAPERRTRPWSATGSGPRTVDGRNARGSSEEGLRTRRVARGASPLGSVQRSGASPWAGHPLQRRVTRSRLPCDGRKERVTRPYRPPDTRIGRVSRPPDPAHALQERVTRFPGTYCTPCRGGSPEHATREQRRIGIGVEDAVAPDGIGRSADTRGMAKKKRALHTSVSREGLPLHRVARSCRHARGDQREELSLNWRASG